MTNFVFDHKQNPGYTNALYYEFIRNTCVNVIRDTHLDGVDKTELHAALTRYIIREKTYSNDTDPIIPYFVYGDEFAGDLIALGATEENAVAFITNAVKVSTAYVELLANFDKISGRVQFGVDFLAKDGKYWLGVWSKTPCGQQKGMCKRALVISLTYDKLLRASENFTGKRESSDDNIVYAFYFALITMRYDSLGTTRIDIPTDLSPSQDASVVELFASPFTATPKSAYYSLFPDVDAAFGSRGKFPEIADLIASNTKLFVICEPPNVAKIIDDAVEKTREILQTAQAEIVLVIPNASESDLVRKIETSSYFVKKNTITDHTVFFSSSLREQKQKRE